MSFVYSNHDSTMVATSSQTLRSHASSSAVAHHTEPFQMPDNPSRPSPLSDSSCTFCRNPYALHVRRQVARLRGAASQLAVDREALRLGRARSGASLRSLPNAVPHRRHADHRRIAAEPSSLVESCAEHAVQRHRRAAQHPARRTGRPSYSIGARNATVESPAAGGPQRR